MMMFVALAYGCVGLRRVDGDHLSSASELMSVHCLSAAFSAVPRACISFSCGTFRTVSALSVYVHAWYRECGPRNPNDAAVGIGRRRTRLREIGLGVYYEYRR